MYIFAYFYHTIFYSMYCNLYLPFICLWKHNDSHLIADYMILTSWSSDSWDNTANIHSWTLLIRYAWHVEHYSILRILSLCNWLLDIMFTNIFIVNISNRFYNTSHIFQNNNIISYLLHIRVNLFFCYFLSNTAKFL